MAYSGPLFHVNDVLYLFLPLNVYREGVYEDSQGLTITFLLCYQEQVGYSWDFSAGWLPTHLDAFLFS